MSDVLPLSAVFVAHAASQASQLFPVDPQPLEDVLERLWQEGAAKWPGFVVVPPLFAQYIAERVGDAQSADELLRWLGGLSAGDLYLACGCLHGIAEAIRAFDQAIIARVPSFVSQQRLDPAFVADVMQELRRKLLVCEGDRPPAIASYGGRGELANFVRAAAIRTAISMKRPMDEKIARDDGGMAERLAGATADPALENMKRQYRTEFQTAISAAIAALPSETRSLLRMYYVDGIPGTRLATLFKLNQSTIARKIAAARAEIFDETKRLLRSRLQITDSSYAELSRLVLSQLDLSMSRLLS